MLTSEVSLFTIVLLAYPSALFLFLFSQLFRRDVLRVAGTAILVLGFAIQTVGLVLRALRVGTLAVTNMYETLVFYSWVIVLAFLVLLVAFRRHLRQLIYIGEVAVSIAFAFLAMASSPLFSSEPRPLVPALQSHWLALHVSCAIAGEGFFAVAFVSSALLIWLSRTQRTGTKPSRISLDFLDSLSYKAIAIGFPLFTLGGLFFGAIWAQHAWGRYWGWDPKETFTLVTWLVYVVYLHLRVGFGWRGRRLAWVAVMGFLLALFTFAGVNYLLRGLHSYR